jgi:hypothetical protein
MYNTHTHTHTHTHAYIHTYIIPTPPCPHWLTRHLSLACSLSLSLSRARACSLARSTQLHSHTTKKNNSFIHRHAGQPRTSERIPDTHVRKVGLKGGVRSVRVTLKRHCARRGDAGAPQNVQLALLYLIGLGRGEVGPRCP